jgi:dihydrodipicolinate synthase/N-acetylneuraminate lyase
MRFEGILPAVTTPFEGAGEVDLGALEANVAALLDAGVHGLVANGTMGEAGSLSRAERRTVVEAIVRAACGRVPCHAAELDAARAVYRRLLPLARFDMTPKLVQYFKAAMDAVGHAGGPPRPPRLPLTAAEREQLDAALAVLRGAPGRLSVHV